MQYSRKIITKSYTWSYVFCTISGGLNDNIWWRLNFTDAKRNWKRCNELYCSSSYIHIYTYIYAFIYVAYFLLGIEKTLCFIRRKWSHETPVYDAFGIKLICVLKYALTFLKYSIPQEVCTQFCFAVRCCGYTLTDFPISIRLASLALCQSNDCPSGSKATPINMDKYFMWIHYERLHNHNKAKHNKTVCLCLGIYCI